MSESSVTPTQGCPICGKPSVQKFRPFCSKRCADVDLHRWFSGTYSAPAAEQDEPSDADAGGGRGDPD
jgi:endogenous inhibitor of DNA gyrase (YacG/DUF329 family)